MVTLRCRQSTESSRWRHGGDGPEKERSRKGQRSHEPGGNEAFAGESAPLLGVLTSTVDYVLWTMSLSSHRLWMCMSIPFAAKAIVRSMPAARARQPTPYNRQSEKVNLQGRLLSCRIK